MAANVVVIRDEKEWEIISRVLGELQQGGIIIPPESSLCSGARCYCCNKEL